MRSNCGSKQINADNITQTFMAELTCQNIYQICEQFRMGDHDQNLKIVELRHIPEMTQDCRQSTKNSISSYLIELQLQKGSFGQLYACYDNQNQVRVAIKVEHSRNNGSLLRESKILKQLQGIQGVPKFISFGHDEEQRQNDKHEHSRPYMVMQLLGFDLTQAMRSTRRLLSMKTTLMIGIQIITILEQIHSRNVVHRDIKPENIMVGTQTESFTYGSQSQIFLVDYGISTNYQQKNVPGQKKNFVGTLRYASQASHKGIVQTFKDDLESLGYVLIFICQGRLPWTQVTEQDRQKKTQIVGEIKLSCNLKHLCQALPVQFENYFEHLQSLEENERPNYGYLIGLLNTCFDRLELKNDGQYDWMLYPELFTSTPEPQPSVVQQGSNGIGVNPIPLSISEIANRLHISTPSHGLIFSQRIGQETSVVQQMGLLETVKLRKKFISSLPVSKRRNEEIL